MKNTIVYILIAFLIASCGNTDQPKENTKQTAQKTKVEKKNTKKSSTKNIKKKKKPKRIYLTDDNAEAFLMEYGKQNNEDEVVVKTKFGDIKIKLYHDTPIHRANMIYLAKNNFYKDNEFYRVIPTFMIQAGQSDDPVVQNRRYQFGKYGLKSEILPHHFHKRGAVAMGRGYDNNPDKLSSSYNFYIVQGKIFDTWNLNAIENTYNIKIPENHRDIYRSIGGSPHIDGDHTVFGEVYEGMAVVDSICKQRTDDGGWPINSVYIDVEVIK